jgi:uncharacterized protein
MKNKKIYFFFLFLFIFSLFSFGLKLPERRALFNDYTGKFEFYEVNVLDKELSNFYLKTGVTFVIAVVNDYYGAEDINEFANLLFEKWRIGDKKEDNGLLMVYNPEKREVRIEVGYGLEGVLNDAKVGRILDDYFIPYIKKGRNYEAFHNVISAVYKETRGLYKVSKKKYGKKRNAFSYIGAIFLFILWFLIFLVNPRLAMYLLFRILISGGKGGFSGGGFGNFGGGSSGGGGASRRF